MKRLCLVLLVGLSVQLNAASAPFLHMHADEAHETDHHEGAVVHRHVSSHTADGEHHQDAARLEMQDADASSSVESHDGLAAMTAGGLTARISGTSVPLAPSVSTAETIQLPRPAIPPDDDVGHRLPDSPQSHSSSHRGPPR